MKITMTIKDGKFIYAYEIGSSSQQGSREINTDDLTMFAEVLKVLNARGERD